MLCICKQLNQFHLRLSTLLLYLILCLSSIAINIISSSDIKCGIPGTSLKSSFNKSELSNQKVVDIGSKLKYSCDYKDAPFLVGIRERECTHDGDWTEAVPKCATLYTGHFETTITRNALNITLSSASRISGLFVKVSSVSAIEVTNIRNIESPECTDNTTFKDRRYSTLFQCPTKDSNIWSHPNVSWIYVTFNERVNCDSNSCPAKVEFIELYEVSADECSKPDVPAFGKLMPIKSNGAVARFRYVCEDFFTMYEKKAVEVACNRYDDWSPKTLPKCEPNVTCEVDFVDELKVTYNWLWSETEAVVGTVATYECVDNTTKINGTAKRECRSNGQWSPEEMPQCIPIATTTTEQPYTTSAYNPYPVNPIYPNPYPTQNPYPNPNQNQYPIANPNQYPTQKPNPYPNPNLNPYPTANPNPYQTQNPYPNPYPTPIPNPYPNPNQNVYPHPNQNPNFNPNPNPNPYQTTGAPIGQFPAVNSQAVAGTLSPIHFVYIFLGVLMGILLTICAIYYFQKRRRDSLSSQSDRQMRSARSGRTVRDEVYYDHMNTLNNTLNESRISNTCLADQTDSSGVLYPYDSTGYVQIEAHEALTMDTFKKYENYDKTHSPSKPLPQVPK